ncbi:hypothetical protein BKA67DRAFT_496530, partial [Truncatella angustata]
DPDDLRRYSISPFSENGRLTPQGSSRGLSPGPPPFFQPSSATPRRGGDLTATVRSFLTSQWLHNGGPILIVCAQFFGAVMNLSARLLEVEDGLHPMQILFARMAATVVCCFTYMRYRNVPAAPWGPPEIRRLLVLRACAGFVGLYGMWSSIMYLPLAEATVISFLAPNVAGYLCRVFLGEPFTRREQLASYLALGGVVLIMKPISLFSSPGPNDHVPAADDVNTTTTTTTTTANTTTPHIGLDYDPTTAERLGGIGMGLLGVVGAAITITALRAIGPRAHPLISVNYFGAACTAASAATLSLAPLLGYGQPDLGFALPAGARQWALLLLVGVCGFGTQFLFTAGLARERTNRAAGMIYTHVLFAAGFDRFVFGQTMGWASVAGCGMVVGSALWVAIGK